MRTRNWLILAAALFLSTASARAWVITTWWDDDDDIVFDDVLSPADPWSDPAQFQMSEWNELDVTDNSHPFRINVDPQFSFGSNDGDNTIGFLGESGLNSEYGLSYAQALAWTSCWSSSNIISECDVMFDPTLSWSLGPDDSEWFQSSVLHELGHVRGLDHYNNYHSMQNSGQSKYLRNEILYMDDKDAVRQHASFVTETDMVMYNKWHDGAAPQWMTMSPTDVREFQTVNLSGITVENRGSVALNSQLDFGVYLSTNSTISTGDQLLNTGYWDSFGTFTFGTFDWSATIPSVDDCGDYWLGGIIDHNGQFAERYEGNNAVAFTNGVAFTGQDYTPTPLSVLLAKDSREPNDSFGTASVISTSFSSSSLNIDEDLQQDFYRFTLSCGERVTASLSFLHSRGDVDLDLRSSGNAVLGSSTSTGNGESITRDLAAGSYVLKAYGFDTGSCNKYSMTVSATDVTDPEGEITSPAGGTCTGGSITVQDDFEDECDGSLSRTYSPGPGPTYSTHGDHSVTLTVEDNDGNTASDSVSFTVDKVVPTADILTPLPGQQIKFPLTIQFTSGDADGAAGGVLHEVVYLDSCPVFDGANFGDNDGILTDETLTLTLARLCSVSSSCGLTKLDQPIARVDATDCGGNVGVDSVQLRGKINLWPGLCGP